MKDEMNKTYEQLMTEYWGRVVPMVNEYSAKHNTDIKPWECVKLPNYTINDHPTFRGKVGLYKLAVAILEGKPVFAGDMLWNKLQNGQYAMPENFVIDPQNWTWHEPKPKRTFLLNGVELPCPVKRGQGDYLTRVVGNVFYFTNCDDRNFVDEQLYKLLTEARDKE